MKYVVGAILAFIGVCLAYAGGTSDRSTSPWRGGTGVFVAGSLFVTAIALWTVT